MTTREMLKFMKENGYSLQLMSSQSGVGYFKVYRHATRDSTLSSDDKAALWRFALAQPVLADHIHTLAEREK